MRIVWTSKRTVWTGKRFVWTSKRLVWTCKKPVWTSKRLVWTSKRIVWTCERRSRARVLAARVNVCRVRGLSPAFGRVALVPCHRLSLWTAGAGVQGRSAPADLKAGQPAARVKPPARTRPLSPRPARTEIVFLEPRRAGRVGDGAAAVRSTAPSSAARTHSEGPDKNAAPGRALGAVHLVLCCFALCCARYAIAGAFLRLSLSSLRRTVCRIPPLRK
jgi:hypothetical protein